MDVKGIVFNIQKFSLHDGPGIRTTVFLKGCPLRCKWCSNPESQLSKVQIMYHAENCMHCKKCVHVCPRNAISIAEDERIRVDFHSCTGCLACVQECPGQALTSESEWKTADEVLRVCLQDIDFYEESGGGVTISGGEGMVQPDFAEELVLQLREKGIHTAIETTGCVDPEIFHRLAPLFHLLLFDVKHFDSEKHRKGTGAGNEVILKNLRWAYEKGLNVLIRIPVIPGFNEQIEDAEGIAGLLKGLIVHPDTSAGSLSTSATPGFQCDRIRVQLLPFHQMGERKYEFLNRSYELSGIKALHQEDLTNYQKVFLDHGIDCFF
ncbi:MAG: glycyl-radical enzyme activating protein [Lachnospiraceae bacterium]|nr:glycyl-radical enzyme activating protein [Lachnospiraceae bacterium]